MLHSDQLANEFNDILNGVEIFAPFQPLDPAVSFYAPLRNNVRDLRLNQDDFQRASDAWYKDGSGIYRNVGINRARFEESRLLMEPAQTNKCLNYNANPDAALTEIYPNETIATREFNPAAIAAAGLQDICTSGYVFQFDNQSGLLRSPYVGGVTGNTNVHTCSVWANSFGADVTLKLNGGVGTVFNTTSLERVSVAEVPLSNARVLQFQLGDGERIQFVLNKLAESSVADSPIVTEGTAGQRAIDLLTYASANNYVNFAQGMIMVTMQARADFDDLGDDYTTGIATLNDQTNRFFHMRRPSSGNLSFRLSDGTNLATSPAVTHSQGDLLYAAGRWVGAEMQVGFRRNNDPWLWNPPQPYDGLWPSNNLMTIARSALHPWRYGELFIYDEDRGTGWIEANYP